MGDIPGYSNPTCDACGLCRRCKTPFIPPTAMREGKHPKEGCILVIGEAPGAQEDADGIPFHPEGASGKLLRKELTKHGLQKAVTFCNSVRCRPKDNKLSGKAEVKLCRKFLYADIEDLRPAAILILGNKALYSLTGREGITKRRRQIFYHQLQDGTKIPMMAGYHPAFALYDMNNLPAFKKDIETFVGMVSGDVRDAAEIEDELLAAFNDNATAADIERFHKKLLKGGGLLSFDAETNSLSPYIEGKKFRVTMLSFSNGKETLVARLDNTSGKVEKRDKPLRDACLALLKDRRIRKVAHNGKYDMHAVWVRFKVVIPNIAVDTMLLHAILHPINTSHSLEDLSMDMLGVTAYHAITGAKAKKNANWLAMAEDNDLVRRAGLDAACTYKIYTLLWEEALKEDQRFLELERNGYKITDIFNGITMPCMYTLFYMERNGFPVDLKIAERLERDYREKIERLRKTIRSMKKISEYKEDLRAAYMESPKAVKTESLRIERASEIEFNPSAPVQVTEVLYKKYHIPKDLFNVTKGGALSADVETLNRIKASKYYKKCKKLITRVLRLRHLEKGYGTYIIGVTKRLAVDGNVHASFRMDVAKTMRLSGRSPNLQNLSRKHKDLRQMYVAPKGWKILEGDYSQIELRIMAAESGDRTMVRTYIDGADIHDETARDVWGIPAGQEVSDEVRVAAKRVNFGIVYLISPWGLQRQIGGTEDECQRRINGVYKRFPGVKRWQNATSRFAEEHGRVYSLFGHWRDVKNASAKPKRGESDGWSSYKGALRQAVNAPIQGAAGFVMFVSMNKLRKEIKKRGWNDRAKLINTVHDSLMLLVKEEYVQEVAKLMRDTLESEPVRWLGDSLRGVPIKIDLKVGSTWATMEKLAA